jgi:predicted RNase H-like nuclease (RuvC/YqgF family)
MRILDDHPDALGLVSVIISNELMDSLVRQARKPNIKTQKEKPNFVEVNYALQ